MGGQMSAEDQKPMAWPPAGNTLPLATFAAGCFWGTELLFQRQHGVHATAVGYIGGRGQQRPSYEQVCSGNTGHTEAVQMTYDPQEISYETLVDTFYQNHNPRQRNGQGGDRGTQYRSAIFYHLPEQKQVAEAKKAAISGAVTEIADGATHPFWAAETYHQQYLQKGGRFGHGQSAAKGEQAPIRCYG